MHKRGELHKTILQFVIRGFTGFSLCARQWYLLAKNLYNTYVCLDCKRAILSV